MLKFKLKFKKELYNKYNSNVNKKNKNNKIKTIENGI